MVLVPHPHYADASIRFCRPSFLTCKILVAPPLSVWEIDWASCLVLGTDADILISSQRVYLFHATVHSKLLHAHLAIADCCLHSLWGSMIIALGSSSSGAVRRAASSTLAALSTATRGCCFCCEAHLTLLLHWGQQQSWHRGAS